MRQSSAHRVKRITSLRLLLTTDSARSPIRMLLAVALFLATMNNLGCDTGLLGVNGNTPTQDPTAGDPVPAPEPTPSITSLMPGAGPLEGGTRVTIRGEAMGTNPAVLFDGEAGFNTTVINSRLLTVETPAHTAGMVDVRIVRGREMTSPWIPLSSTEHQPCLVKCWSLR